MDLAAKIMVTLGALLLLGLITDGMRRFVHLPKVTLLIIVGFLLGPSVFNFIPEEHFGQWFPVTTQIALAMIGFLLGGKITVKSIRQYGRYVLWISLIVVTATGCLVFFGLLLLGVSVPIALLLAGLSAATAPAGTAAVVTEMKIDNQFSRILLGIVAVDDAWALIAFSLFLVVVHLYMGHVGSVSAILLTVGWEIGGAVLLGVVLGFPMAYLTGRVKERQLTLIEAIGIVFVCGGLAVYLKVSFLLAAMVLGFIVANFAKHHERPFHAIEAIEWPFLIIFFILAGAALHADMLYQAGLVGLAYIVLRLLGRVVGAYIGGIVTRAEPDIKKWMGIALLPQAGVAIGMSLVASQAFPSLESVILPVALGATVIFEIVGPVLTRFALLRSAASEK